jgi:hypothetical protein
MGQPGPKGDPGTGGGLPAAFVAERGTFNYDGSAPLPTMTLSGLPAGAYLITAEGYVHPTNGTIFASIDFDVEGDIDSVVSDPTYGDGFSITKVHTFTSTGQAKVTFGSINPPNGVTNTVAWSRIVAVQVGALTTTNVTQ